VCLFLHVRALVAVLTGHCPSHTTWPSVACFFMCLCLWHTWVAFLCTCLSTPTAAGLPSLAASLRHEG
jgi:hypothetical protein